MYEKQQLNKDAVVASGIWKFREDVSEEVLIELANQWAAADTEGRYLDLHVRKCSKNQFGIGFKYVINSNGDHNKKEYDEFFYGMSDKLKRQFGNGLIGWDIASKTTIII